MSYNTTSVTDLTINAGGGSKDIYMNFAQMFFGNKKVFSGGKDSNLGVDRAYYFLPFSGNKRILINIGRTNASSSGIATVAFLESYNSTTDIYFINGTHVGDSGIIPNSNVSSLTNSQFNFDSKPGNDNKPPFFFIAIGITNVND